MVLVIAYWVRETILVKMDSDPWFLYILPEVGFSSKSFGSMFFFFFGFFFFFFFTWLNCCAIY